MVEIHLKIDRGTPQYACSSCCDCRSIYGKSLCSEKNRGCCWYFPKFTLHDIHKMAAEKEGYEVLQRVRSLPKVKVYNYYIHSEGYFDKKGYEEFLKGGQVDIFDVADKSIFFRLCPFVNPGTGCTLPAKFRTYVCNFYICSEIYHEAEKNPGFKAFIKERAAYVKWIEWENQSLEMLLREEGLNLVGNFEEVISLLKEIPVEEYEFPNLNPVEIPETISVGA